MEEVLKWFNYPHTRAHPGCEVAREYRIVALSILCPVQPDSGENCTVLQSGPTRCLIAKFPQHSVVACQFRGAGEEHCEQGHGWVCANL